jgi:hypothetical protein
MFNAETDKCKTPLAAYALLSLKSKGNIPEVAPVLDERQMNSMYNIFLRIRSDNAAIQSLQTPIKGLIQEYRKFKFKDTNLTLSAIVILLILGFVTVDVLGFYVGKSSSPSLSLSSSSLKIEITLVLSGVLAAALFIASMLHRFCLKSRDVIESTTTTSHLLHRIGSLCLAFDLSSAAVQWVNDGSVVFLTLFTGLSTLSRTLDGGCVGDPGVPAIGLWACDTASGDSYSRTVPMVSYGLCLYVVLLMQLFCKGASRSAICLSW